MQPDLTSELKYIKKIAKKYARGRLDVLADLIQEGWIGWETTRRKHPDFDRKLLGKAANWAILTYLRNKVFHIQRVGNMEYGFEAEYEEGMAALDDNDQICNELVQNDRKVQLYVAIACLTPLQRQAVELNLEDLSYVEAARYLAIPIGAYHSRLASATKRLKELMCPPSTDISLNTSGSQSRKKTMKA